MTVLRGQYGERETEREWWTDKGVNAPEIYVVTGRMKFHRGRYAYISGAGTG